MSDSLGGCCHFDKVGRLFFGRLFDRFVICHRCLLFIPPHPYRHHSVSHSIEITMKVTIKQWNAVAAWRWDMPDDDVCGICRNPYDSTCSKCKFPGDECPLLLGECNHSFHMHCIFSWLRQESSQEKCPMCRQPFKSKAQEATRPTTQGGDFIPPS